MALGARRAPSPGGGCLGRRILSAVQGTPSALPPQRGSGRAGPRGPAGVRDARPSLSSSMEMCDQRHNITMCPLCDKTCSYWRMSSACATARASHLFDNPATVFFSIFMALWGKRSSAGPSRAPWRARGGRRILPLFLR